MNVEDKQERWSQYFTPLETAEACRNWLAGQKCIEPRLHSGEYFFVEPSAGTGVFYSLMPWENRIAYEIDPELAAQVPGCITQDFLALELDHFAKLHDRRLIFIGNPPFGFRGKDALAFISKSFALGAEYVAFILPPAFVPDADGDPPLIEQRIEGGYSVAHMMVPKAFDMPVGHSGKDITGCAFVLYKKGKRPSGRTSRENEDFQICFVANREGRRDAVHRIPECDYFFGESFYPGHTPKLVKKLEDCPGCQGHGIIIKGDERKVVGAFARANWEKHSRQSPNGLLHINQRHVKKAIAEVMARDESEPFTLRNVDGGPDLSDIYIPRVRHEGSVEKNGFAASTMPMPDSIGVSSANDDLLNYLLNYDWKSIARQSSNGSYMINQSDVKKIIAQTGS